MLPDINLFYFTLPVALLLVGDWMTPTPSHRAHAFHGGGAGYYCSIYILNLSFFPFAILLDLVFKFMTLTFIFVTHFSIHTRLAWNQLSSSCCSIHQHSLSYATRISKHKNGLWKNEWWLTVRAPLPLPPTLVIARLDKRINPGGPKGGAGGRDHNHWGGALGGAINVSKIYIPKRIRLTISPGKYYCILFINNEAGQKHVLGRFGLVGGF